jgi:transcriptional regulator with XRE-family HTH domain
VSAAAAIREQQKEGCRREVAAVGLAVARLRRKRRWTQERLARAAGVSVATLCHLERGSRGTRVTVLVGIAAALDVPPGLLFDLGERIRAVEQAVQEGCRHHSANDADPA